MILDDVLVEPITPEMMEEAKAIAEKLKVSLGQKTRAATENRDIIGSLAHNAVENKLRSLGVTFESYRTKIGVTGDGGDILYDGDLIDVKGTHGKLDEKYFYNKSFLVFDKELPRIESIGISHFVFVQVDIEEQKAYIYGAIRFDDFMENSVPVTLQWENHGIKAYQLKPFINYVYRT